MKKLLLIAPVLLTVISLFSCTEDPAPMVWEFSDYEHSAVQATYTPGYVYEVALTAPADYSGEITLNCTNYVISAMECNTTDGTFVSEKAGIVLSQINNNTVKVTFMPVENMDEADMYEVVSISGKNEKETNITNMLICRVLEEK